MTFEELNSELNTLIGQSVSFKRVAANSVIIYFFGGPGDSSVLSVFIDPNLWRYEQEGKVILGSYDVSMDESESDSRRNNTYKPSITWLRTWTIWWGPPS